MKKIILILLISIPVAGISQSTIGLLHHTTEVSPGYTLFTPEQSTKAFLINNCGELINEWYFSEAPGATCYLLEDGNLLRVGKDSIEVRDWNSQLIWSYATTENGLATHHDIHPLPNGNILCIASDIYSNSEITEKGRNPNITDDTFKLDRIVELERIGTSDAIIVWEWRFIDHLIQDFDNTKENFGIVEDHPELLDINFNNNQTKDWTHINAIEYNAELDQILITSRHLSELYIIDHSTTTEEAANNSGDFLWRWGNPQVYRQGNAEDQKLKWPHDAKWVKSGYFDYGKISVFNNNFDGSGDESIVHLIKPKIDNNSYTIENNIFLPETYNWSWSGEIFGEKIFAQRKSGTQSLPNGNLIICEYTRSTIFEITKNGDLVWAYKNPVGSTVYSQYGAYNSNLLGIFRGEKYPPDFSGFDGKDLTPQGIIEDINTISNACVIVDINSKLTESSRQLTNSPVKNGQLTFNKNINCQSINVFDMHGKNHKTINNFNGNFITLNLKPGIYLIQIITKNHIKTEKIIVQ